MNNQEQKLREQRVLSYLREGYVSLPGGHFKVSKLTVSRDMAGDAADPGPRTRAWGSISGCICEFDVPAALELANRGLLVTETRWYTGSGGRYGTTIEFRLNPDVYGHAFCDSRDGRRVTDFDNAVRVN